MEREKWWRRTKSRRKSRKLKNCKSSKQQYCVPAGRYKRNKEEEEEEEKRAEKWRGMKEEEELIMRTE